MLGRLSFPGPARRTPSDPGAFGGKGAEGVKKQILSNG